MNPEITVCGGFRCLKAETATNGAIGPPVAPIGAGRWRQSALGGGANWVVVVAPIGWWWWRQSNRRSVVAPIGGGANRRGAPRTTEEQLHPLFGIPDGTRTRAWA
eukprot:COSAG02_NODE_701_length_18335_cov_18.672955_5_plen_105_part_00